MDGQRVARDVENLDRADTVDVHQPGEPPGVFPVQRHRMYDL